MSPDHSMQECFLCCAEFRGVQCAPEFKPVSRPASLKYSGVLSPRSTRRAVYGCVVAMNEQYTAVMFVRACVHGLVQQRRWNPRERVLKRRFVEYQKRIAPGIVCTDWG